MLTPELPKRHLRWFDVVFASSWTCILWPVWMQAMGPFLSILTAVASATFLTYCLTEVIYWLDRIAFKRWMEDNKDQINDMDEQFKKILESIREVDKKGRDNESDQATRTGNCEQEARTKGTKKEE